MEEPWKRVEATAAELKKWSNDVKASMPGPTSEDLARMSDFLFGISRDMENLRKRKP